MNFSQLEAILLFGLSIPVVMKHRILPVDGTPYWLFGILFALLTGNIFLTLYPKVLKKNLEWVKGAILWLVLGIVVAGTMWTSIVDRHKTAPVYGVHDIILQQETAMRYLLEGKNPYKEEYFGTSVEEFNYGEPGNPDAPNPALYHFVMPPWYLLFPFSIYLLSIPLLGFFDGRMALIAAMIGLLLLLWKWFKNRPLASLAVVLTALSPSVIDYFIEGRSDIFALFWFIWALYLLERKRFMASSIIFAFALMSKQTIWIATPFYLLYLWRSTVSLRPRIFWQSLGILLIVVLGLVGPFLWWDSRAYIASTVQYLSGSTTYGYPVSGYGFGMVLNQLGIIKNTHAYYPFIIWQILFALPVAVWSLIVLIKKPEISRLILGYAFTLIVFWYFSRYLNNSHLGYVSSLFVLGVLKAQDEGNI